jgi:hypothetical protein
MYYSKLFKHIIFFIWGKKIQIIMLLICRLPIIQVAMTAFLKLFKFAYCSNFKSVQDKLFWKLNDTYALFFLTMH